jgi:predicted MPP superfamily phosphohydrolase
MRITHTWTDEAATIKIEGLAATVRLLHVTDTHLALIDERDADHVEACSGAHDRFGARRLDADGNNVFTETTFDTIMAGATSMGTGIDLLAHTGDLIHFPSQANIERASAGLTGTGLEFMYTSGNHDWLFSGVENVAGLREQNWPLLDTLTGGRASHEARDIGGIRFVAVDNSIYQVSEAQLEFVVEQLSAGLPTVLLTHIPISLPTLRGPTIQKWETPLLMADPAGDPLQAGTDVTIEFVRTLLTATNLVANFCGHVHFEHIDSISPGAVQYVGTPAFETGRSRLFEFQPLP